MSRYLYKEQSRQEWYREGPLTDEQLKIGAIQRIADATEAMAKNYVALQDERDRYKGWFQEERELSGRLFRRISALRGQITKLKRQKGGK
jgi:hypothetical protein